MWAKLGKKEKLLIAFMAMFLVIGAVLLTTVLSYSNMEDLLVEQLTQTQLTSTKHAANKLESVVMQARDELIALSKFPVISAVSSGKCRIAGLAQKIDKNAVIPMDGTGTNSVGDNLLRANSNGDIIECSSGKFSDYAGLNIKNKGYFKIPQETREPFVEFEKGNGRNIIVSVPLFETTEYTPYPNFIGRFNGVLLTILDVDELYDVYVYPLLDQNKNIFFIVNPADGRIILNSEKIDNYDNIGNVSLAASKDAAIINVNGLGKTIATKSELYFGTEHWRLVILTPLDKVGKDFWAVQKKHLLSLGFFVVVTGTMAAVLIVLYKTKEDMQSKLEKANINLENLGIKIDTEKGRYTQADISLEPKHVYLIKDDNENSAHELFISCLNNGYAGLGIVRENPSVFRERYNLQKTSFIWLTSNKVIGVPCESNMQNLYSLISEFVRQGKKSVVLIDRLDYILSENDFELVIKKLHALKDLASSNDCIIILSVSPGAVEEGKLKAIEADSIDLYGKALRNKAELSGLEFEILGFVNENNVKNRLVAYKDITEKIGVTKPTTRVKLDRLLGLGLLSIDKHGRFKSIKITSSGRRLIS